MQNAYQSRRNPRPRGFISLSDDEVDSANAVAISESPGYKLECCASKHHTEAAGDTRNAGIAGNMRIVTSAAQFAAGTSHSVIVELSARPGREGFVSDTDYRHHRANSDDYRRSGRASTAAGRALNARLELAGHRGREIPGRIVRWPALP